MGAGRLSRSGTRATSISATTSAGESSRRPSVPSSRRRSRCARSTTRSRRPPRRYRPWDAVPRPSRAAGRRRRLSQPRPSALIVKSEQLSDFDSFSGHPLLEAVRRRARRRGLCVFPAGPSNLFRTHGRRRHRSDRLQLPRARLRPGVRVLATDGRCRGAVFGAIAHDEARVADAVLLFC